MECPEKQRKHHRENLLRWRAPGELCAFQYGRWRFEPAEGENTHSSIDSVNIVRIARLCLISTNRETRSSVCRFLQISCWPVTPASTGLYGPMVAACMRRVCGKRREGCVVWFLSGGFRQLKVCVILYNYTQTLLPLYIHSALLGRKNHSLRGPCERNSISIHTVEMSFPIGDLNLLLLLGIALLLLLHLLHPLGCLRCPSTALRPTGTSSVWHLLERAKLLFLTFFTIRRLVF